ENAIAHTIAGKLDFTFIIAPLSLKFGLSSNFRGHQSNIDEAFTNFQMPKYKYYLWLKLGSSEPLF
ncbi:MAG: hypothetical protein ACRDC6_15590, partial [Shewanella sp.]